MTKYKKIVLDIINTSCSHLTANEVFNLAKEKMPKIVLATIYNNLNALVNEGLIKKISIEGQIDRYDKIKKHDHLVCQKCGKLIDFNFDDYTNDFTKKVHANILGYDLKVFIICDECKRKEAK